MDEQKKRQRLGLLLLATGWLVLCVAGMMQKNRSQRAQQAADATAQTAQTAQGMMATVAAIPTPTPEPTPTPPPTREQVVEQILTGMTPEEKIGQMFIGGSPALAQARADLQTYHLGGYILFTEAFRGFTPEQVRENNREFQELSTIPLLIGVDEEGGGVTRISTYRQFRASRFLLPRQLYAEGGLDRIDADTAEKAQFLLDLGLNVNFAPVCDISTSGFMRDRSLGQSPEITAEFAARTVQMYNQNGVGCVLKHFPGYGNNGDTHRNVVYDKRDYDAFASGDFLPFIAGVQAGECAVLVSHNVMCCVDDTLPASLSPAVHQVLRETIGFEGVIVTDDLTMNGVRDFVKGDSVAVDAILAGNDLLCCKDYRAEIEATLAAYQAGDISEERLDESVRRILLWKYDLGLLGQEE